MNSTTFYQLQKLVYNTSFLLDDKFTKTAYTHKELSELIDSASKALSSLVGFNLPREIYSRLLMPGLTTKLDKIKTEFAPIESLHDSLDSNPSFVELESRCNGVGFVALQATIDFTRQLINSLPKQSEQKQEEQQEKINRIQQLRNHLSKINKQEEEYKEQGGNLPDDKRQERKEIIKEGKQLAKDVAEFLDQALKNVDAAVSVAADKAKQSADDANDLIRAAGWDEAPEPFQEAAELEDKMEALQKIKTNSYLKKLILEAGNQRQLLKAVKQKKLAKGEIIRKGTKSGDDIRQALPHELMLLGTHATKMLFNEKLAKKSLTCHKTQSKKKLIAGKTVIFRDLSSSMASNGGFPNIFAGAITWVMAQEMVMQNREVRIVNFNQEVVSEFTFNQKNYSEMALLSAVNFLPSGSTGWSKALDRGVDFIRVTQSPIGNEYDFILITDGDPNRDDGTRNPQWMEKFARFKSEYGVNLYGVMVDYSNPTKELVAISDQLLSINQFSEAESEDLFGLIV